MEIILRTELHPQEALALAEEILRGLLRKRITLVSIAIDSRKLLREAYSMVPIFSPMFLKMIALGEYSGHLSSSFARISKQNQESQKK